jgi:hypothetical protein
MNTNDAKIILWTLLAAVYERDQIKHPSYRNIIIDNIEQQKQYLLLNILGDDKDGR